MRSLLVVGLILVLAACARSRDYHPGDSFTAEDANRDRNTFKKPLERVDRTETSSVPRTEEITIPVSREQVASGKKPTEAPKVQLLLNQMQVSEAQISVGEHAGLVVFTAKATIDGKDFPVQLEGHLHQDSTADLLNVNDTNKNFRAEVFCNGDVKEGFYSCDSLFIDLYFKSDDAKFYREQLQLISEEQKNATASPAPVVDDKTKSATKNIDNEDEQEDVPDAQGTFVGRPDRVLDLFAETNEPVESAKASPSPAPKPAVKERPVKKGDQKPNAAGSGNVTVEENAATSGNLKKKKEQPKPSAQPQQKAAPLPQSPKPVEQTKPQPKPQPQPAAQPKAQPQSQPTAQPTAAPQKAAPQPKPAPETTVKAAPVDEEPLHPAKVVLEMTDDPNRPTDQAIGGYGGGGKLENASSLPFEGDNYYFSQPQEQHNYATYDLVRVIKIFAAKVFNEIMPGVKLRLTDLSARHGGHLPPHKGHQNGLEADIGYLTVHSHERVSQAVIAGGHWLGTMAMKEMWQALKFLGASSRVSLVFVNPGVKPHICSFARAKGDLTNENGNLTLRKIKEVEGHTSHFHLRLECGRYNPRCRTDGPPSPSTGC